MTQEEHEVPTVRPRSLKRIVLSASVAFALVFFVVLYTYFYRSDCEGQIVCYLAEIDHGLQIPFMEYDQYLGAMGSVSGYQGTRYGETTLEEGISHSDVVIRSELVSATATYGTFEGKGIFEGEYFGVARYSFRVLEYLKGKGPDQVTVEVSSCCDFAWTLKADAKSTARKWIDGNDQWHDVQMVVFLQGPSTEEDRSASGAVGVYSFAGPDPINFIRYLVDSDENIAWLPEYVSSSNASSESVGDDKLFLTDWTPYSSGATGASVSTIKLSEIKKHIAAVEAEIAEYETPEVGRRCVSGNYGSQRFKKANVDPRSLRTVDFETQSGQPAGTEFLRSGSGGSDRYHLDFLTGDVGKLFPSEIVDDNEDPSDYYQTVWTHSRPIPAGIYSAYERFVIPYSFAVKDPCLDLTGISSTEEFKAALPQTSKTKWRITVTAPEGTLHEAFFDPAALTDPSDGIGVRYNPKTSFTLPDKTSVTLDYLYYVSGIVKMGTTPHNALAGYEMDIIELDGKVSSTFAFGGSGSTSSPHEWATCVQPWDDEDKLMLRIRKTGTGSASALAVTPCPTYTLMPSPTATSTLEDNDDVNEGIAYQVEFYGTTSLTERILHSDQIIRAKMKSVQAVHASSYSGVDEATVYRGFLRFKFEAIEYLKGSGKSEIEVYVDDCCGAHPSYPNAKAAETSVSRLLADRDTTWDGREAIIFVQRNPGSAGTWLTMTEFHTFALPWSYAGADEFMITSTNKVWLPEHLPSGTSASSKNDERLFLTDAPPEESGAAGSAVSTISLKKMKEEIQKIESDLQQNASVPHYKMCLQWKTEWEEREKPARKARGAWPPPDKNTTLGSGLPSGTSLVPTCGYGGAIAYHEVLITGEDKEFFQAMIIDDGDPENGYSVARTTNRPLPTGEYKVRSIVRNYIFVGCGYRDPEAFIPWTITVTAPQGTLHEAFFDPVALTNPSDGIGVRYNPKTSFTLPDQTSVTLDYLYYALGVVKMGTTPHNSLFGYEMDIIELDGKVSSTFAFGGSGSTSAPHEWATCVQPWEADDKLMLRIRKTGTGSASASAVTPCPN